MDTTMTARINGIALHAEGQRPDEAALRELAWTELLRQHAVQRGLLAPTAASGLAPALDAAQRAAIDDMLDREVPTAQATEEECRRYYDANPARFVRGQAVCIRHILFAVTPGVNVQALAERAQQALRDLSGKDAGPGQFERMAAQLSNCPSGREGGELGWITPEDCAPELAQALFRQPTVQWPVGLHPQLVHSRHGLHIIEVLARRDGRLPEFAEVREPVAAYLALCSRSRALHQFMRLLAGQADIDGIELDGTDTPLVQ